MLEKLKQKALLNQEISQQEAEALSKIPDKEKLYQAADEIRHHFMGDAFDLCSITNAKSGKCPEDCCWCAQSAHYNAQIDEYDIVEKEQAVEEALNSARQDVAKHSLVTSGRTVSDKTLDELIGMYQEISKHSSIGLCASLGLISKEHMQRLKTEGGIQNYHCNLETAPSYFPELVSTHTLEEKIQTIRYAQEAGINVCSGGIIGMGESMEQRIELAISLRELNINSIPINFLQAIEGTPLQGKELLSEEEILTTIALFRFINPKAHLRFAGGRTQIKAFEHKALKAGINAAITGDYLTSTGSNIQEDKRNFRKAGFKIQS